MKTWPGRLRRLSVVLFMIGLGVIALLIVHHKTVAGLCADYPKDEPNDGVFYSYTYQDCTAELGNHSSSWALAILSLFLYIVVGFAIAWGLTKLAKGAGKLWNWILYGGKPHKSDTTEPAEPTTPPVGPVVDDPRDPDAPWRPPTNWERPGAEDTR